MRKCILYSAIFNVNLMNFADTLYLLKQLRFPFTISVLHVDIESSKVLCSTFMSFLSTRVEWLNLNHCQDLVLTLRVSSSSCSCQWKSPLHASSCFCDCLCSIPLIPHVKYAIIENTSTICLWSNHYGYSSFLEFCMPSVGLNDWETKEKIKKLFLKKILELE